MVFYILFLSILSVSLIFLFTRLAYQLKLIDVPNHRKRHHDEVPLVGGLAIYFTILVSSFLIEFAINWMTLLYVTGVVTLVGALDDALNLGYRIRLIIQISATCFMLYFEDIRFDVFGLGVFGIEGLPGYLIATLLLVAIVALTNALNMMDGLDGLAASQFLIALGTLLLIQYYLSADSSVDPWLLGLMVPTFIFLIVNLNFTPLRKVFLGDSGSMSLGFLTGWTLLYYSQQFAGQTSPAIALWCVTIPVFDMVAVVLRRVKNGFSPFGADRKHIHHLLLDLNLTESQVLLIIGTLSVLLNLLGLGVALYVSVGFALVLFFLFLVLYLMLVL